MSLGGSQGLRRVPYRAVGRLDATLGLLDLLGIDRALGQEVVELLLGRPQRLLSALGVLVGLDNALFGLGHSLDRPLRVLVGFGYALLRLADALDRLADGFVGGLHTLL